MANIGRKSETWSSRFGFIMASVGSAVGLGNFWRFPYTAGENGGGAFILIYVLCVAFIALPLLMGEYAMGRKSGMSAVEGVQSLARAESRSQKWGIVAWTGSLTSFFILSFYMVISVWLAAYLIQAITGTLSGATAEESGRNFLNTIGQGEAPVSSRGYILTLLAAFIAATVFVVGRGVRGGLERAAIILMPAFFIMLLIVVGYSVTTGDASRTLSFVFEPNWGDVGFKTVLAALSQAFFSIGVGLSLMITYGAYLDRKTDIPVSSAVIVSSDTFVSLIAVFAIFPIVFAAGLNEASGAGLFFVSMPVAFEAMPGGNILAIVFFALALFAAFTSSISLMEVAVSWLEERQGVTRSGAATGIGAALFMVGAAYVFSLDYLDFVDFMTEGLLLPLGGLFAAVFAGWVLSRDMLVSELGEGSVMNIWRFIIRWCVPPFIAIVLVFGFLDKLQDDYAMPMPGFLHFLIGPNAAAEG